LLCPALPSSSLHSHTHVDIRLGKGTGFKIHQTKLQKGHFEKIKKKEKERNTGGIDGDCVVKSSRVEPIRVECMLVVTRTTACLLTIAATAAAVSFPFFFSKKKKKEDQCSGERVG
jgi:hypothetical protein